MKKKTQKRNNFQLHTIAAIALSLDLIKFFFTRHAKTNGILP